MLTCPACRQPNALASKFCAACGAPPVRRTRPWLVVGGTIAGLLVLAVGALALLGGEKY